MVKVGAERDTNALNMREVIENRQQQGQNRKTFLGKATLLAGALLTTIRSNPSAATAALGAVGFGAYSASRSQFSSVDPRNPIDMKVAKNVGCTHMILGPAKSKTTAVAKALCEVFQREGGASCLHEPLRMLEVDETLPPNQRVSHRFQYAETTLCKDMLCYDKQRLTEAIEKTVNPIVLIKGNPYNSFLSILDIKLAALNEKLVMEGSNLKAQWRDKPAILKLFIDQCKPIIEEIKLTARRSLEVIDDAKNAGKQLITIRDEDLTSQPKEELNRVLSIWGKPEIGPEQEMTMSASIDLRSTPAIPAEVVKHSYQFAALDLWDTVKGKVFAPSQVSRSADERIDEVAKKYVPENMRAEFRNMIANVFVGIEDVINRIESQYAAAKLDRNSNW